MCRRCVAPVSPILKTLSGGLKRSWNAGERLTRSAAPELHSFGYLRIWVFEFSLSVTLADSCPVRPNARKQPNQPDHYCRLFAVVIVLKHLAARVACAPSCDCIR
jgi:hypothetical protein